MCRNRFLNLNTLPRICYNILKMASIEVKLITSSSHTWNQVAVFGTDLPANFFLCICMSRIPCLWLCPILKQGCVSVNSCHLSFSLLVFPTSYKQQGWEFAHWFSERIAHFLRKYEWLSDSLKKTRDSLIRSVLVSDLSDLLMIAHSFWATWENCSWWLICPEWPEWFTHFAQKEWANLLLKKTLIKTCKKRTKNMIYFLFWANCSFFESKREKWAICSKKEAIRLFAHLSWVILANEWWTNEQIPNAACWTGETGDMRHETGYVRQETWVRRCETGDMRYE